MLDEFPKEHEGLPVSGATLDLSGTGHGLDDELDVMPIALQVGDEFSFIGRARVEAVNHPRDKKWKGEGLHVNREHKAVCVGITIVDDKVVSKPLTAKQKQVDKLKAQLAEEEARRLEEAAGIQQMGREWTEEEARKLAEDPDAVDADQVPGDDEDEE